MDLHRKMIAMLILAIALSIAPAMAGDVTGNVSASFFSHYMWRGERLSDGFVIQPSATLSSKGLSATVWANYDAAPNKFNEVDFILCYCRTVGKTSLETGYIYYGIFDGVKTQEIYFSASYANALNPKLTVFYDVDKGKGAFVQASFGHTLALSKKIGLNLGAQFGMNINDSFVGVDAKGKKYVNFHNGEVSASTSIPLHKSLSLDPIVAFDFPLSTAGRAAIRAASLDGEANHLWGGATIKYSF